MHRKYAFLVIGLLAVELTCAVGLEGARKYGFKEATFYVSEHGYGVAAHATYGGKERWVTAHTYETPGYGYAYENSWDVGTKYNFRNDWFFDPNNR